MGCHLNWLLMTCIPILAVSRASWGRPWRVYSRTVYLESYIDDFIDPSGWTDWNGNEGLDTLYYGEYENDIWTWLVLRWRIELLGKGIM